MRLHELHIETHREVPARPMTAGEALLFRAGYLASDGALTELGERLEERVRTISAEEDHLLDLLGPQVRVSEHGEILSRAAGGGVTILRCHSCGYAALEELARRAPPELDPSPMLTLEKVATPDCDSIEALARYLGISRDRTAKALMLSKTADGAFALVLVRGDRQLSAAKLRDLLGDFRPATTEEIQEAGAVPGFASPIGLVNGTIIVDQGIAASRNLVGGANESGFHFLNTNCGRDYQPGVVADIVLVAAGDACPLCDGILATERGDVLRSDAGWDWVSVLAALAANHHDPRGLTLPPVISPFLVYLLHLPSPTVDTVAAANEVYGALQTAGIDVLFDDRDVRAGVKFNDADLLGFPLRVAVSERSLRSAMVEFKRREGEAPELVGIKDAAGAVQKLTAEA